MYREQLLLWDPNVSSAYAQQRVASMIAHEQAHQWLGNLVTLDCWSHLWLNEGFARFYESFGAALVRSFYLLL